jgi:hypothetical protein
VDWFGWWTGGYAAGGTGENKSGRGRIDAAADLLHLMMDAYAVTVGQDIANEASFSDKNVRSMVTPINRIVCEAQESVRILDQYRKKRG